MSTRIIAAAALAAIVVAAFFAGGALEQETAGPAEELGAAVDDAAQEIEEGATD